MSGERVLDCAAATHPRFMAASRRRQIVNCLGGAVVALWLVMIGLLIYKNHFQKSIQPHDILPKAAALKQTERTWMEIYLKDTKVGYALTQIDPMGEDFLIWEELVLNLNLMGQASVMRTNIRSLVDQGFRLKRFTLGVESGIVRFHMSGTVEDGQVIIETGRGNQKKTHAIPLKGPPVTGGAISLFFRDRPLKIGESFTFLMFDPTTMAQKSVVITVAERETVIINRIRYNAFRLETEMWGQELTFWVDESGEMLKEKGFLGLTLVRSNAATATRDLEGEESFDFYEMASVPVTPKLQQAESLTYLKLKAEGLDKSAFDSKLLNSGRQRFSDDVIQIRQEKMPLRPEYLLPWRDVPEGMSPYLRPGFNIESDDPAIVEQAHRIVGPTRDPAAAAQKVLAWVYSRIEKRPVLSLPSAAEVLKTRTGDCNEHAVLLTALLRAIGIPARECVGLVYANGRFFYHAWTEAYMGRWISMDATLNQMPTDAAHIKLVQGGLERQTDIIPLIGKLKLSVIDYGYHSTD